MAEWQLSDAWVFSAIEGRSIEDGYTLAQIIAKGDGINHAIITEEEFIRAVPRLINAGLVGACLDEDRYWHTETGRELYTRRMKCRGLFGWIDAILPALRRLGPAEEGTWVLPPGTFRRAVDEWNRQAAEFIEQITQSRRRGERHHVPAPGEKSRPANG